MSNFCSGFSSLEESQTGMNRYGPSFTQGGSHGSIAPTNWFASRPAVPDKTECRQSSVSATGQLQGDSKLPRTSITDISPHQANTVLVGLVIAKQKVHSFLDKKNPGNERCKFTFTLRDSPSDYINATCWGSDEHVRGMHRSFKICDVVEVYNGQISSKRGGEDDKWYPWTSSQYQINISETHSRLSLYSGWDYTEFTVLAHVPLRPANDLCTLSEIVSSGQMLNGSYLNILAVVKQSGGVRSMVSKAGKPLKKCDIFLMDEGCPHFLLVMWDDELIELAQTWTPKDNIILAVDVKVTFDTYRNTMVATCDQKTVITTNPDCREAHHLYQFAQSVDISSIQGAGLDSEQNKLGSLNDSQDDIKTISQVYTVEDIKVEQATKFDQVGVGNNSFTGILYAYLTSFDIDQGTNRVVCYRCSKCNYRVERNSSQCSNKSCSPGGGLDGFRCEPQFNILVSLSDCTGSVESVVLTGQAASGLLMSSPQDFLCMSENKRTEVKSGLLLEKFKVYFKSISSLLKDQKRTSVRVLSMALADPQEAATNTR